MCTILWDILKWPKLYRGVATFLTVVVFAPTQSRTEKFHHIKGSIDKPWQIVRPHGEMWILRIKDTFVSCMEVVLISEGQFYCTFHTHLLFTL